MKKKLLMAVLLLVIGLLAIGVGKILAQSVTLPRVKTACETKLGGILVAVNDGFSSLKSCPGASRAVTLGEAAFSGNVRSSDNGVWLGKVAFFYPGDSMDVPSVLDINGGIWELSYGSDPQWWLTGTKLPNGMAVSDILYWAHLGFMTKDGRIYILDSDKAGYNLRTAGLPQ